MTRLLLTLLILVPILPAQDEAPPLSPTAQRAVAQFDRAEARAKADYDAAMAKATDDLLEDLEREKTRATKRGDLDGALAIDAVIKAHSNGDFMGGEKGKLPIDGPWKITYDNNYWRLSDMKWTKDALSITVRDGNWCSGVSYSAKWNDDHQCYIADGTAGLGKSESYTIKEGKLRIRHWHGGSTYDNPAVTAVGVKEK